MKKDLTFLGIETSCDETAASVVREDAKGNVKILSNVISSQVDEHLKFGGVVPENAARSHAEKIDIIIKKAIDDSKCKFEELDGVAAMKTVSYPRWWEAVPADLQGEIVAELNRFMLSPTMETAESVMATTQKLNAAYWADKQ